ncbi:MAG: RNA polymerase sigma factor [Planctomycetota bacterium]
MEAIADGAFVRLVREEQGRLWRYLRLLGATEHEAADMSQDAFVVLAERLGGRGPAMSGEQDPVLHPAAFLRGTARNLLIAARRRARREVPAASLGEAIEQMLSVEPDALDDARIDALRACVQQLDGRMAQAVRSHHLDGRSCESVAAELGLGANGIKSLLSRARRALRDCVNRRVRQESE